MPELCLESLTEKDFLSLLRVLFEYMRCAVSISRGDGIFMAANAECEASYGFKAEEYVGKSLDILQGKGIFNPSVALRVIREKRTISTTLADKSGFTRPIVGVPVCREPGRVAYVICLSAWDITSYDELQGEYRRLEAELRRYSTEVRHLRAQGTPEFPVLTENAKMREINQLISQVAHYKTPVLFIGESGVGKTYCARRLHSLGPNSTGPFIEVNCGTTPDGLLELELFGPSVANGPNNVMGDKVGALQLAHGGTLLLKEIHAMPLRAQSRLAALLSRVRETRGVRQPCVSTCGFVGDAAGEGVRILASTERNLNDLIKTGEFREELYYALNSVPVEIPPLRKRPEDILAFIFFFLERINGLYKLRKRLAQPTVDKLLDYPWPGNIMEIRSVMERLMLTSPDVIIRTAHLPECLRGEAEMSDTAGFSLKQSLEFYEKRIILQTYEVHKTTVALAKALGISQPSAARKLAKYRKNAKH